jgi:hypothetical protein
MIITKSFHFLIIIVKEFLISISALNFHFLITIIEKYSIIVTSLLSDLLSIQNFIKLLLEIYSPQLLEIYLHQLLEIYLHRLLGDFIDFRNSLIKLAIQLFIDLDPLRLFFY